MSLTITFCFTLIHVKIGNMQYLDYGEGDDEYYKNFGELFYALLKLSFISDSSYFEGKEKTPITKICILSQILISVVVMLNLLISIIGDTFDSVKENFIATDCQEKCSLILEVEELIYLLRKVWAFLKCKSHEESSEKMFLHVCKYIENSEANNTEWAGRVRVFKNQINSIGVSINKKFDL
jgi:hypothetical protein